MSSVSRRSASCTGERELGRALSFRGRDSKRISQISWEGFVKLSHVHCRVLDLSAAVRWFDQVWQVKPTVHNERMAWLRFGEVGVILDAAPSDSAATLGFDSEDCDADYRDVVSRGAESTEAPQDRAWGYRVAYLKGPGELTVEIEQPLGRT